VKEEVELARFQIAARAIESDAQRGLTSGSAFIIALLVFGLGLMMSWRVLNDFILFLFAAVFGTWYLWILVTSRSYKKCLKKLDGYAQDIQDGVPLPSLEAMCLGEKKARFYRRIWKRRQQDKVKKSG
jgi:hypothetical protein